MRLPSPCLLCLCWLALNGNAASFTWLGDLPGGEVKSQATAISADGRVVVGHSSSASGVEAFRYADGVMTGLGDLPGKSPFESYAYDVSADGSVIVGRSGGYGAGSQRQGFRFANGVMAGLGFLPGVVPVQASAANGVSDDGLVIVGQSTSPAGSRAVVLANGMWESIGVLPGMIYSAALAVSGDGKAIVGDTGQIYASTGFVHADGAMTAFGEAPAAGDWTLPQDASADGRVIVGATRAGDAAEAFRYAGGVITRLGFLPGGDYSTALAVSADGRIVVGESSYQHRAGGSHSSPFVWTAESGMRPLDHLLLAQGAPGYSRWEIVHGVATGISADGLTIVGYGTNAALQTEAFVAVIDGTSGPDADGDRVLDVDDNCIDVANADQRDTDDDWYGNMCDGDLNNDRAEIVNFADLAAFRQAFGTSNPHADFDGNGFVNAADLARFRLMFGRPPGPSGWDP